MCVSDSYELTACHPPSQDEVADGMFQILNDFGFNAGISGIGDLFFLLKKKKSTFFKVTGYSRMPNDYY